VSDQTTGGSGLAGLATYISTLFSPTVLAPLRNVLSGLGVLLGMLGFGATLSPETIQKIIEICQQVGVVVGAIIGLIGIITPLVMGAIAAFKSTQGQQIKSVQAIATGEAGPAAESAQTALIEATRAVAQDKSIPKSDEAKDTLINATISLDNVQTIVTDKETAKRTPSQSVVAAEEVEVVPKGG
jgi:hypothetical protein